MENILTMFFLFSNLEDKNRLHIALIIIIWYSNKAKRGLL